MSKRVFTYVLAAVLTLLMYSCANIGTPEGGPRDYTPPVMLRCNPEPGTVNFKGRKVEIQFDENINLKDQMKKVIVSPAPAEPPSIKALGKKVTVEFRDDLLPNTTYVIDFTTAIEDNNEGNVLDGFAIAFSTGESVDSLRTSGMVLQAKDLEPMQYTLVGLHTNLADSAFTTLPFDRVTRTNDRGEFTFLGLAPGRYRIYAMNDMDGNYRYTRTEDCAWIDDIVVPTTSSFESMDTVFTFDHRVDTVKAATHTEYLPNNLLLQMFNENYKALYLRKSDRPSANRLQVLLSTRSPEMPRLDLLSPRPVKEPWYTLERRPNNDSIVYWITDSTLIESDSIVAALRYLRSDSLDQLSWTTDTVNFIHHKSNSQLKEEAQKAKEHEKRLQEMAKLKEKRDKLAGEGKETTDLDEQLRMLQKADSVPPPVLQVTLPQKNFGIADTLAVTSQVPISSIDTRGLHLSRFNEKDSVWTDVPTTKMIPADTCSNLRWIMPMRLESGTQYRFTLDKDAVRSVYDIGNDSTGIELTVRKEEEYANLYLRVTGLNGHKAFVELLNDGDKPIRQAKVDAKGTATFMYVEAGVYYARLVLDLNDNGRWDTGNYGKHLQPEDVFYYPEALKLRKNWDVDQTWNIYGTAVNLQKPEQIKRNQPEAKKNALDDKANQKKKKRNGIDDEEEETDEFNTGFGGRRTNTYSGDKYRDSRR